MKCLLDTHILLWAANGTLPKDIRAYFAVENDLYFSPASIWEIVIKRRLNREDFRIDLEVFYSRLLSAGYKELLISSKHSLCVDSLPDLHKDPFDRILLAQAVSEDMTFITADKTIKNYPYKIIAV